MAALELLSDPLWRKLAWTLLHFIWQGAAVGLLLFAALPLLHGARTRYLAALGALVVMIACPLATFGLIPWETQVVDPVGNLVYNVSLTEYAEDASWQSLYDRVQPLIILVWLMGVSGHGLRLALHYAAVVRLRLTCAPLPQEIETRFRSLAQRMQTSGVINACQTNLVAEALVVGLFRPLVLLPTCWLTELSPQVIEAVLAHELAHIRRHDLWVNLLQRISETLLFYHPAVWYISRVLRIEREKCCDELAVAVTGQKVVYVEALELAAHRRLAASTVWVAAMGGTRKMNLLDRVRNVLGLRAESSAARYWPVGVAALVLPLGMWCATLLISPAATADESETQVAQRDGEERPRGERDGDRPAPREGERREGDRPAPREGERREGDRPPPPREGERREGDRPAPREGERREGDRPAPRDGERPFPPREGDRPFPPREGDRPLPPVPPELMRLIAELRQEVMQLRREVNELREGRLPPRGEGRPEIREGERPGPRPDARPEIRREGDRPGPRPEGDRPGPRLEERERAERREGDAAPRDGEPRRERE